MQLFYSLTISLPNNQYIFILYLGHLNNHRIPIIKLKLHPEPSLNECE